MGGAESYIASLSKLLKENGHEVFFFSTDYKPFLEENYEYTDFFPKYTRHSDLHPSQYPKYLLKIFYNYETERKLNELLKKIKPDIVHASSVFHHLTASFINPCYKNKIPIIMSMHGCEVLCPAKTLIFKGSHICKGEFCIKGNPLPCIVNKCEKQKLLNSFVVTVEFLLAGLTGLRKKTACFICPGQAMFDLALRAGIKRDKLAIINNFLDEKYFAIEPEYGNKGYFLYAGRLSKEKGIEYLLEAMSRLPETKLHIAGRGPYEKSLKELALKLNLNNVEFLGFKTGMELENEYKYCIAGILPSNCFETFGLTIAEAFAYGKPSIASNIGGIPEVIDNNINGILFEPGDVDALTDAIKTLNENPDLAVKFGKNGRSKAENTYNQQIHYQKLIQLYTSVLNGL